MLYPLDMARYEIVWRILTLRCVEAARLSSESLDRALPGHDRLAWRLHLLVCVSCRRYRREVITLRKISTRLREPVDPPGTSLPDEVRERIKRSLKGP
jgi:hypothetical protein